MSSPETAGVARPSLAQDWLNAVRYWLGGRRGLIVLAATVGLGTVALSWGWLVAVGIAPLLLTFAPCAAMCALGLCASRMGAGSCSSKIGTTDNGALDADLVVVGTRGLTGLKRILLGSVTDEVLRGIECDVLAVPPR
jgi:hypothetical protein